VRRVCDQWGQVPAPGPLREVGVSVPGPDPGKRRSASVVWRRHLEPGDDLLNGGNDNDTLVGGSRADELYGNGQDDPLTGGPGDGVLHGNPGDDTLNGGGGVDSLFGGAGTDSCVGEQVSGCET